MTLFYAAIGFGVTCAAALCVLAVALGRPSARREAIAAQQERHRHPAGFAADDIWERHANTAVALANGFAVATRDTSPFEAAGVNVINPWQASP